MQTLDKFSGTRLTRLIWDLFPLSVKSRKAIKKLLLKALPAVFGRFSETDTNAWSRTKTLSDPAIHAAKARSIEAIIVDPVPLLKKAPLEKTPVRLIAFYLPQFHPIPENDRWWGDGFTEWTNVKSAVPQFVDHYQPHVSHALGYYDLRHTEVQRRQIELANAYGIGGFCFYFYWFAGKRLLEKPVLNYLENPELKHPFCLCWANENWTRRWDGRDSEILIGQNHSKADDLAFIEYISRYLKDERYIQIHGKPLLLVYRPSLLTSARQTARRWRKWCRDHGIGEIFLAYTQSFEKVDPIKYGFDAAIEFPPNISELPELTDQVVPQCEDFDSKVYDWKVFVERSEQYARPAYTLFRGVNPGWDNTARRKNKGSILVNSSPLGYQTWLNNATLDTLNRFDTPDERLVFVNAWNEWAEGAHLEPDLKFGYAYLEASRMAMVRAGLLWHTKRWQPHSGKKERDFSQLAVVVHAFYPDVFEEIVDYAVQMKTDIKLFVTAPHERAGEVKRLLKQRQLSHFVLAVDNCGRDILPFFKIIERVKAEGFEVFVKVHTKKSKHRGDGDVWRKDLYRKMLLPRHVSAIMNFMEKRPDTGMVGPEGHIVPMTYYLGANEKRVLKLAARMGIDREGMMKQPFVAGSMFFCRLSAISPLLNLAILEEDFEAETGQMDGTLAHAIERAFTISVASAGMRLVGTDYVSGDNAHRCHVRDDYAFAERS